MSGKQAIEQQTKQQSGRWENVIKFENVGMRYGNEPEVLRDVNFQLDAGSFHFLMGPSGAGKSSLLKLLYLSHRQSRGLITMFGQDITNLKRDQLPELRRQIGVVYQDFRLIDHLSTFDNVALPLRINGIKEAQVKKHVAELLEWVGLEHRSRARPATLSGGEKQRVAIARAVINRPRLLLADEPTGSVDQRLGLRLLHMFEQLNRIGTTVLIATHDEANVRRFQKPLLAIHEGEVSLVQPKSAGNDVPETETPPDAVDKLLQEDGL